MYRRLHSGMGCLNAGSPSAAKCAACVHVTWPNGSSGYNECERRSIQERAPAGLPASSSTSASTSGSEWLRPSHEVCEPPPAGSGCAVSSCTSRPSRLITLGMVALLPPHLQVICLRNNIATADPRGAITILVCVLSICAACRSGRRRRVFQGSYACRSRARRLRWSGVQRGIAATRKHCISTQHTACELLHCSVGDACFKDLEVFVAQGSSPPERACDRVCGKIGVLLLPLHLPNCVLFPLLLLPSLQAWRSCWHGECHHNSCREMGVPV